MVGIIFAEMTHLSHPQKVAELRHEVCDFFLCPPYYTLLFFSCDALNNSYNISWSKAAPGA